MPTNEQEAAERLPIKSDSGDDSTGIEFRLVFEWDTNERSTMCMALWAPVEHLFEVRFQVERADHLDIEMLRSKLAMCRNKMRAVAPLRNWEITIDCWKIRKMSPRFLLALLEELIALRREGATAYCHNVKEGTLLSELMDQIGLFDTIFTLKGDAVGARRAKLSVQQRPTSSA